MSVEVWLDVVRAVHVSRDHWGGMGFHMITFDYIYLFIHPFIVVKNIKNSRPLRKFQPSFHWLTKFTNFDVKITTKQPS